MKIQRKDVRLFDAHPWAERERYIERMRRASGSEPVREYVAFAATAELRQAVALLEGESGE